ncbi:zeta-sarcoglycan-like [Rhincodon typus]|uniref:zeta-sarcoglycan-like n=1 Tax=Rhincodon typus TaxID=259920 RepID=UPI0009A2E0CA|nr:zeta-sarcoglycan-like [Rhincodon typus]
MGGLWLVDGVQWLRVIALGVKSSQSPCLGGVCGNLSLDRLESPTRTLTMEAPKGVHITAAEGDLKATCRRELQLQSTDGEIFLNAKTIRLGNIPQGSSSSPSASPLNLRQTVYEVCVCPNGKLFLSPAATGSTCQSNSNVCLRI